ncbi:MAG: MarR family transcriptional regulator [Thermoleophilaceae bacterium]|nr:MarR family transcriptional regulator [Thermoleophilaceae bacterium]
MAIDTATKTSAERRLGELELAAWRGFLQAHAVISRRLDSSLETRHGLSLSSYEVLLFLAGAPEGRMRMSELADSVLLSRSGLTRLVDRLVRDGLVERASCPADKRGLYAVLTEAGRQRFEEARRTHLADVREHFISRFSEEELAQIASFFERLVPAAVAESGPRACG